MLLRCFSSHAFLRIYYWFIYGLQSFNSAGFPHSDSHGSRLISSSPWIFAAFHVLRRLSVPRHPPLALCSFTFISLNVFLHSPKFFGFIDDYVYRLYLITVYQILFDNAYILMQFSMYNFFLFAPVQSRLLRSLHYRFVHNGAISKFALPVLPCGKPAPAHSFQC